MQSKWMSLCSDATSLSADEARALEERLAHAPDDVALRVQLVGAGFLTDDDERITRRIEHLAWLAEHRPDIDLGGFAFVSPELPAARARLCELWSAALERHRDDVRVLRAGASFLAFSAPALALAAYERAALLEPDEARWQHQIARMHARLAREESDPARTAAHFEAEESALTKALSASADDVRRSTILRDLAQNAVARADWPRARSLARALLESAASCEGTWQYGNAVHHGHILLGRVALAEGDEDGAAAELAAAAETPGSPQLNSFGPDLELAGALARRGRLANVIAYLEAVRAFWTHRAADIDEWLTALRRGDLPDFAEDDDADDEASAAP